MHFSIVVFTAIIGMLMFAAATQNFFLTNNRIWETLVLLLVTFMLFRPGYFWDKFYPPYIEKPGIELVQIVETLEPGTMVLLNIKGENMKGKEYTKLLMLPVGNAKSGVERLNEIGFETRNEDGKVLVDNVVFGSKAVKMGVDFDQEILMVKVPAKRPPRELVFIPAFLLIAVIYSVQRKRRNRLAVI